MKRNGSRLLNLLNLTRSFATSLLFILAHDMKLPLPFFMMKKPEEIFFQSLNSADIVVPVGGGYIRSTNSGVFGIIDLLLVLQPIFIANSINKPVVLYSQSIGPFETKLQERIVRVVLKNCKQINLREDVSYELLLKIGVPEKLLQRTSDAAFSIPAVTGSRPTKNNTITIGVTARSWLKSKDQDRYESQMADAIDKITKKFKAHIVFIPQVTETEREDDDRVVQERIYRKLANKKSVTVLTDEYDFLSIKAIYGNIDYLIGTRFHSVIFSLCELIPCIAIEYEHKTKGIMNDLGLRDWVLPIESLDGQVLYELFCALQEGRLAYVNLLKAKLPGYIEQSDKANDLIVKYLMNAN